MLMRIDYCNSELTDLSPNSTCCVTSRHARFVTSVSCVSRLACSNMANDVEAVVLACISLVFCPPNLYQSQEQLLEKVSTPVRAVATPLSTCRASRGCHARSDEHVAPCYPTSATQHVTTFFCTKMHGLEMTCRDVTQQVEFGLYRTVLWRHGTECYIQQLGSWLT